MNEICDILHEQAKADGMGMDRERFIKQHRRLNHKWLLIALENLKNPIKEEISE
jgi:hypothetical protein